MTGALAAARAGGRAAVLGLSALEVVGRARLGAAGPAACADRLRSTMRRLADLHGFRITVEGPLPAAPAVIVANHLSYADAIVLGASLPFLPIAKADVEDWPIVGAAARSLGVLFIQRGHVPSGVRVLRAALRALAAGVSILNFPEGTTTNGREVLPFRRGIFGAAVLAGVPVVPAAIRYDWPGAPWTDDAKFLPHYLRTAARAESGALLRFAAPIDPAGIPSARELAQIAHREVERLNLERRPQEA